ncbi:hypothetical protein NC652_029516 [Populus alba x Populus x berolinensis]|nr:hypothetical protein NC652_029516 [Populus alba x Populus x berolinensis]
MAFLHVGCSCFAPIGSRELIPFSVFSLYFADFQFLFHWGSFP